MNMRTFSASAPPAISPTTNITYRTSMYFICNEISNSNSWIQILSLKVWSCFVNTPWVFIYVDEPVAHIHLTISYLAPVLRREPYEQMESELAATLRAAHHLFISVEVYADGKRVGGNGVFMRVDVDSTCKQILDTYLRTLVADYHPLPSSTPVNMMCCKLNDTFARECFLFLDYPMILTMPEIPTKSFTLKCARCVEDRRLRVLLRL